MGETRNATRATTATAIITITGNPVGIDTRPTGTALPMTSRPNTVASPVTAPTTARLRKTTATARVRGRPRRSRNAMLMP